MPPSSPIQTSHKIVGRQRRPHRFDVSWLPLPGRWIRCWIGCSIDGDAWCKWALKVLFTCGVKKISVVAHKSSDVDGMCKRVITSKTRKDTFQIDELCSVMGAYM